MHKDKKRLKNKFFQIATAIFSAILILYLLHYFNIFSIQNFLYPGMDIGKTNLNGNNNINPDTIIAKVGAENIYQKDLDIEIASYPLFKNEDDKKVLLQKIIKDSIVLQAAKNEGWIQLDNSVFNSYNKDYLRRTDLVADVRRIYVNKQDIIAGKVISIWFHNTRPGPIGYERGKEVAFAKITGLHNNVRSGRITPLEAAQRIIDDKDLEKVDVAYKSNAIFSFRALPGESITLDTEFDEQIRKLSPGEVTDVFLIKDKDSQTGNLIDTVYMFASIEERTAGGNKVDFDQWYEGRMRTYEIIYN